MEEKILTPVGRLVGGSLYKPQTKDALGNPLIKAKGPDTGKPYVRFWVALAIAKGKEQHWRDTQWGQKVWKVGNTVFQNAANSPTFAWKIKNGDDLTPNKDGKIPAKMEGYAGHWILNFSSEFAPKIYSKISTLKELTEKDAVNLGDYIQIDGIVSAKSRNTNPGIFLNYTNIALIRYGVRIKTFDPENIGFGGELPPGAIASETPITEDYEVNATVVPPEIKPYPEILEAPAPSVKRVMLPKANGASYEAFIAKGWTDQMLISQGYMAG